MVKRLDNKIFFAFEMCFLILLGGCSISKTVVYDYSQYGAKFRSHFEGEKCFTQVDIELEKETEFPIVMKVNGTFVQFDNYNDIEDKLNASGFKATYDKREMYFEGGYVIANLCEKQSKITLRINNSSYKSTFELRMGTHDPFVIPATGAEIKRSLGYPSKVFTYNAYIH